MKQLPNKKETEEKYVEFVRENKIILATMDYEEFDPQNIRRAYITKLSEKQKLLDEETYNSIKDQIEEIWELLKNIN